MFSKHLKQTQVIVVNLKGDQSNKWVPAIEAMTELFAAYCANRNAIACGVTSQDVNKFGVEEPTEVVILLFFLWSCLLLKKMIVWKQDNITFTNLYVCMLICLIYIYIYNIP